MPDGIKVDLEDIVLLKATRGCNIVHSSERYKNNLDSLADVLEDLMAYAATVGKDFDKELETARRFFAQDTHRTRWEKK